MKRIVNLLLTFIVLWVATTYFPESVSVIGFEDLIVTVLVMFGLDFLYGILAVGLVFIGALLSPFIAILNTVLVVLSAFCWTFIKLIIVDNILPGFSIDGNWVTYLCLVIALSIFSINCSNENKEKQTC